MNKIWVYGLGFLLMGGILASCAGLDLGDIVHVKTPHTIQQQTGLPAKISLNEAETEYRVWFLNIQDAGTQWQTNIEKGNQIRGLLSQLTLNSLDELGPIIAGVPVLGASLPVLSGLVGIFLGVRGKAKGKEKSYNAGLKKAEEINHG